MASLSSSRLISVVVPHFDRADLLALTLDSLCCQSYGRWEALVVDDGSTDATQDVVALLTEKDPRIRFIRRDREPKGANTCRNIGIEQSRGDYLIFLDSDDLLSPHCLQQRIEQIELDPESAYLVFQTERFRTVADDAGRLWNTLNDEDLLARFLRLDSVWHTTGPIWRKEAVQALGGFDERLACWQDVEFHVRALAAGLPYRLLLDLPADCYYREHETGSISQQPFAGRNKLESLSTVFTICAGLSACRDLHARMISLARLGRVVAFKQLESGHFDLYMSAMDTAAKYRLFPTVVRSKIILLSMFFKAGGYHIKGTYRLRPYFQRWLEIS